jgi:actin-like ATPase involved in cell morphogenesis
VITAFADRVSSLNEPCAAADGAETPIDEAL